MGILLNKYSREVRTCTKTTRKRIYKNFDSKLFVEDIKSAKMMGKFNLINQTEDIEVAAETFTKTFCDVLEKHAPLKVVQNRKNYIPYIQKEVKEKMAKRDDLKEEAAKTGNTETYKEYQKLRNEVSTLLKTAKPN